MTSQAARASGACGIKTCFKKYGQMQTNMDFYSTFLASQDLQSASLDVVFSL
jgi:hypothetical protein